jgi:hypothetical protein
MIYGSTNVDGFPIAPHIAAYWVSVGCCIGVFRGMVGRIV